MPNSKTTLESSSCVPLALTFVNEAVATGTNARTGIPEHDRCSRRSALSVTSEKPATAPSGHPEPVSEIDAATRRLMAALDGLERAVERRHDADRDEDELAARIQALGADRSRLADELDGSLVKTRKLERVNREIAERLDAAIGTIRAVLDTGEGS